MQKDVEYTRVLLLLLDSIKLNKAKETVNSNKSNKLK